MLELAYNLESFNPAFTAVLLKVELTLNCCRLCYSTDHVAMTPVMSKPRAAAFTCDSATLVTTTCNCVAAL